MWRNRNVWIILSGEMIAGLGLWTGIIGNLEFMQEKVPSDFMKALIMSVGLLAGLVAGPLAGKVIDQSKKKTVLLISGLGRMLSVIFMLVAIGTGSIWWMVAFMVSIQLSATFYFPALQATIPLVVKDENLLSMNGLHMNVATISRIIGTALAGIMLVYWSLISLYWISMIAYGALLLFTMMLRIDEEEGREAKVKTAGNSGGFMEVFPVLKAYPAVGMTLIMTLIPLLFIGSFNLLVINISEIQDSVSIKGLVYTVEGIAFMAGALAVKYISTKWRTTMILFFFATMVAVAEFMLFFVESTFITLAAFGVLGFALGCFFPTAMVIFQKQMPKEYHGRFFSFRNMLERVMFQVVLLTAGAFLDIMGLQLMVVVFGVISLSLTALFFVQMKRRNIVLEEPEPVAAESV
ncbi:MFS transporter [Sporosarcina sp. Marseille-Q4063]|uniref:MFS transporter n=1 Tax=Sporosarcina sp. Marseille-Q4063 TaxID=2810514 RepID=UPI001BAFBFE7|nr:MFS transporter [Sporosarcina sp. Marseille-Q4063]QUW22348.1 MFS transporter [Sporosarcina sp. Marseille-Q4063]